METDAEALRWQLRLATPKITSLVQNVHQEILCLDSFSEIRQRFTHTVFVRLSDLDHYLIHEALLTPSPVIDLSKDSEQEIDEISRLLFLRWSWADAVLRHVFARLLSSADYEHPGCAVADAGDESDLAEELGVRHGGRFPGDTREGRVEKLISDELNDEFFRRMRTDPWGLSRELDDLAVAPHPDDVPIWRLMARQVADRYRPCLRWPGVHFAAAKAGFYEDGQRHLFEYPFYDEWWSEALSTVPSETTETSPEVSGTKTTANGRIELERDLRAVFDASDVWDVLPLCRMWLCEEALWDVNQEPGTERDFARLESLETFNKYWIRKTQEVVAPVKNAWDCDNEFLQRRHTQASLEDSASPPPSGKKYAEVQFNEFEQEIWTPEEYHAGYGEVKAFFRLGCLASRPIPPWPTTAYQHDELLASYLALSRYAPVPEPKEWFFFASHGNYDIESIADQKVVSRLLESAELDPRSQTWDLVCMLESKRDQKSRVSNLTHILHTIYLTDDMQGYCHLRHRLPGLSYPCDCHTTLASGYLLAEVFKREKNITLEHYGREPQHYKRDHRGGNLVFNRRKLEDTELCQNLDKAWSDWVCHFAPFLSIKALCSAADTFTQQNDCILIRGLGYDDELNLIDPDTIYVLETLPGIKFRQLKATERLGRHDESRPSSE